jgi:hypothetical protein
MGDSKSDAISECRLVAPGVQAEGEQRSVFFSGGTGEGKGYEIRRNGDWVVLTKAGVFRAEVPRESVRALVYDPGAKP